MPETKTRSVNADQLIESVRRFNRFYTRQIGVLQEQFLRSPFSLTEARVIYELAQREKSTATELKNDLRLDSGYLSRILYSFRTRGLINAQPSTTDGRQSVLSLSERGMEAFATLNARSRNEVARALSELSQADQKQLLRAMHRIERLLSAPPERQTTYILRRPRPGDYGWVVQRHGILYDEEYGWNEEFEALVASIVAKFVRSHEPKRERCWIAEMEGENVGSVFLVEKSATTAQLRLMLVEPKARGLGIGSRFVDECIAFARLVGYRKITLWTNSVLLAARHIYQKAGFRLVHREPHHSFGQDLVGETWELKL